jgi:spore germination cell wall hydrolase CwlJ-like protein
MPIAKLLGLLAILAAGVDFDVYTTTMPPERDYGRTCLALVGFSEARDQDDAGMSATMQVVVNRAADPAGRWPRTLCDVVLQPHQFIGVDRWPIPRHPERIDAANWQRALELADQVIAGIAPVPFACLTAIGFDQTAPRDGAGVVCRLGAHTFYAAPPAVAAN